MINLQKHCQRVVSCVASVKVGKWNKVLSYQTKSNSAWPTKATIMLVCFHNVNKCNKEREKYNMFICKGKSVVIFSQYYGNIINTLILSIWWTVTLIKIAVNTIYFVNSGSGYKNNCRYSCNPGYLGRFSVRCRYKVEFQVHTSSHPNRNLFNKRNFSTTIVTWPIKLQLTNLADRNIRIQEKRVFSKYNFSW